jgi:hypothetical protein
MYNTENKTLLVAQVTNKIIFLLCNTNNSGVITGMFEFYQVNPLAMKGLMPSEQFSAMSWRGQVTFCFQY